MMKKFILASSSPRRISLLNAAGFSVDQIISPDVDESVYPKELPIEYSKRVTKSKAMKVAETHQDAVVLSGDTLVTAGRKIILKPEDPDDARRMIKTLSGRRHKVISSVCVICDKKVMLKTAVTTVSFKRLSDEEIDYFVASGEWKGMAGGYTIEGIAGSFIKSMNGEHTNVIGLPMYEAANLLTSAGIKRNYQKL